MKSKISFEDENSESDLSSPKSLMIMTKSRFKMKQKPLVTSLMYKHINEIRKPEFLYLPIGLLKDR